MSRDCFAVFQSMLKSPVNIVPYFYDLIVDAHCIKHSKQSGASALPVLKQSTLDIACVSKIVPSVFVGPVKMNQVNASHTVPKA